MTPFHRINDLIAKHSDIIVAGLVVLILGLMIVRVPPAMMDVFIAANIAIAATVLMVALYVPNAMKLPSFPTILLLTTLFRLALNVSTTRLILLEANAGDIIFAFGDFVVGGNFVVGGVVFVVLVLIQFIVIAKGSERVAEVSARFTLDAMPGKQMSIDADLRGGLIGPEEARERRDDLERESKLYGAMDGAMKFVKGDAIAGIIISLVNIVGGLIVGVMQQGMPVGEAAEVYSLLTIGDGLVSQIPALLLSVSAGLVVTRVAAGDKDKGSHVAREMFQQVMAQPKAIAVVSVVLLGMSILPGFPSVVFWILAGIAAGLAYTGRVVARDPVPAGALAGVPGLPSSPDGASRGEPKEAPKIARGPIPIVLEMHSALGPLFMDQQTVPGPDGQLRAIARTRADVLGDLTRLRMNLDQELGFPFPPIVLRPDDRPFDAPGYAIVLYDAPVAHGTLVPDQVFCVGRISAEQAESLELGTLTPLPFSRLHVPAVTAAHVESTASKMGTVSSDRVVAIGAKDAILEHVRLTLRRHAADFLGIQETSELLDAMRDTQPDLVKAVVPVLVTPAQLTEVLRTLLAESIPIGDLRQVLESIARWGPQLRRDPQVPMDVPLLAEYVRYDMRRAFCARFAGNRSTLRYYSVAPDVEQMISDAMEGASADALALSPDDRSQLVDAFRDTIDPYEHLRLPAVVVVNQPAVRRPLARLLEPYLPEVVVLTYQDLSTELAAEPLGMVMLSGEVV